MEALAREYAALRWNEVQTAAVNVSAIYDKGERAKRLAALARSRFATDRYAAAIVARWDAAKD